MEPVLAVAVRIEAAIAWAFFGRKDAGLSFKAEDRAIHIRFAGEDAGVVTRIRVGNLRAVGVLTGKPNVYGRSSPLKDRPASLRPKKAHAIAASIPNRHRQMVPSCAEVECSHSPGLVGVIQATETIKLILARRSA